MLIEFSLSNYRSFGEMQTLSFRAAPLTDTKNTFCIDGHRLLKIAGVFGADGRGKADLISGLETFQKKVNQCQCPGLKEDTIFQIVLLLHGVKYRYGLALNRDGSVHQEWLFSDLINAYYFQRTGSGLLLNLKAACDDQVCAAIRDYIVNRILILTGAALRAINLGQLARSGGLLVIGDFAGCIHSFQNTSGAQLLFTSHDTSLMIPGLFRRDQIYLTEKTRQDSTLLYSLADLKGIRDNAHFAR